MNQPTDIDVVEFLARYTDLVWKIARAFTGTDADCDDLVQEIQISLWTTFGNIPSDAKESTYVYRVAFNRAVSWHRQQNTYAKHLRSFFRRSPRSIASQDHDNSEVEMLYRAIRELPELDRSLVLLHLDRRSYAEMSEIVGISQAAVGQRLSRARKQLAEKLRSEEDHEC